MTYCDELHATTTAIKPFPINVSTGTFAKREKNFFIELF